MDTPPPPDEPGRDDLGDARVRDLLSTLGARDLAPFTDGIPADVDARITAGLEAEGTARERAGQDLLTTLPAPGPMPADVVERITAALHAEQEIRAVAAPENVAAAETLEGGSVVPLFRPRREGRRRWTTVLAAAAAVAAVGVVGTVVVRTVSGDRSTGGTPARIHVQVSGASYQQDRLGLQARDLLTAPGATLTTGTASGPLATTSGIRSCLTGLGVKDPSAVSVDLASYEGTPAAILVVTMPDSTTAYAVGRDCSAARAHVLEGGVSVP